MREIAIRKALPEDGQTVGSLRRRVWLTTYRGIYPDEKLDHYPFQYYLERDRGLLHSKHHQLYLFYDGENPVGFFSFGPYNYGSYKDFDLCLNHLYVLQEYQGRGLGKQAFAILKEYCRSNQIDKFFCGCNANNMPAIAFYRHMGGIQGDLPLTDVAKEDQIIHFEFYLGD